MNRNSKVRVLAGFIVVGLLAGGAAVTVTYAQQGGQRKGAMAGRMEMMRRGPMAGMRLGMAQLGLSEQQKADVKKILQGYKEQFKAIQAQVGPARRELADAIEVGNDKEAIRGAAGKLATAQVDAALLAGEVRSKVFEVLTPEQKKTAQDLKGRARQRIEKLQALRKKRLDF